MNLKFSTKGLIHNRFDIFKENILTGDKKQVAQAENVILDSVWTNFAFSAYRIWIGVGTGAIDRSRTTMFSYLTRKDAIAENMDYSRFFSEGIVSRRRRIQFLENEQVGQFFSEIGVGYDVLCTHALLTDMAGNPITLEKTSTDIITIYSTIYGYLDQSIFNGDSSITIPIDCLSPYADNSHLSKICDMLTGAGRFSQAGLCFSNKNNFSASYAFGDTPRSSVSGSVGMSYSSVTKKMTSPPIRISAAANSVNPIRYMMLANGDEVFFTCNVLKYPSWSGSFIEKENIGMGDGVSLDFVTDYGFIKSGAIVYVDDVEQVSGVTIDEDAPIDNNIDMFMIIKYQTNSGIFPGMAMNYLYDTREDYVIYENTKYLSYGIDAVDLYYGKLYCSNNLEDWVLLHTKNNFTDANAIPSEYRNYRYWKFVHPNPSGSRYTRVGNHISNDLLNVKNVHFSEIPGKIIGESVGVGDDNETIFSLAHIPLSGTLVVKIDGAITSDFVLDGLTITFNTAPASTVVITADYYYACVITIDYTTKECIKNSNYVIDVSFEIEVGEYTGSI